MLLTCFFQTKHMYVLLTQGTFCNGRDNKPATNTAHSSGHELQLALCLHSNYIHYPSWLTSSPRTCGLSAAAVSLPAEDFGRLQDNKPGARPATCKDPDPVCTEPCRSRPFPGVRPLLVPMTCTLSGGPAPAGLLLGGAMPPVSEDKARIRPTLGACGCCTRAQQGV